MSEYFPKLNKHFGINVKNRLNLTNYATKAYIKRATGVDTSDLAAVSDLASLKAEVDKMAVDKLKTIPADLTKLNNIAGMV